MFPDLVARAVALIWSVNIIVHSGYKEDEPGNKRADFVKENGFARVFFTAGEWVYLKKMLVIWRQIWESRVGDLRGKRNGTYAHESHGALAASRSLQAY